MSKKISEMDSASTLDDNDLFVIVQDASGENRRISKTDLAVALGLPATGSIPSISVESGTFNRLAAEGDGTQTVNTTKRPKIVFFVAKVTADSQISSNGKSDGTNHDYLFLAADGTRGNDFTLCIGVFDQRIATRGFAADMGNITATSFDLNWTIVGIGYDISVQWMAITLG